MAEGDVVKENLIIRLKDTGTQTSRMAFGGSSSVTLAKAFLATYGACTITGASQVQELVCAPVTGDVGEENNVDCKMIMTAKDSTTGEKIRFVISGWKGIATQQGEKGERATDAAGQTCVDAWKTANALPNALVFLRGTPVQRA